MSPTEEYKLNFRCVALLYTLFIDQQNPVGWSPTWLHQAGKKWHNESL